MFYQRVNDYWLEYGNTTLAHVTVVSTGGGYRDFQVRSGLTAMTRVCISVVEKMIFFFHLEPFKIL